MNLLNITVCCNCILYNNAFANVIVFSYAHSVIRPRPTGNHYRVVILKLSCCIGTAQHAPRTLENIINFINIFDNVSATTTVKCYKRNQLSVSSRSGVAMVNKNLVLWQSIKFGIRLWGK